MVESMNGQEVAVMNESVADAIARIELENDVPALLAEMRECLAITVATLAKLGAIIRRLESLDVDVLDVETVLAVELLELLDEEVLELELVVVVVVVVCMSQ